MGCHGFLKEYFVLFQKRQSFLLSIPGETGLLIIKSRGGGGVPLVTMSVVSGYFYYKIEET